MKQDRDDLIDGWFKGASPSAQADNGADFSDIEFSPVRSMQRLSPLAVLLDHRIEEHCQDEIPTRLKRD